MRKPRRAASFALRLLLVAVTVVGVWATAARADTNRNGFRARLRLTSSAPNTPTGAILNLTRPTLRSGKPKTEAVGIFKLPRGTRVNLHAVPPCTKDDTTLQAEGPFACPQSFLGTGYVTLYSGFGPPVDPIALDQQWYYAPSQLVQLVTLHGTKMPVLRVLRVNIKGATFTAELKNLPPGWPPGTTMAPKETDLKINNYVGAHGAFLTTPRRCPRSGSWTTTVRLHYSDHTTDKLSDRTPCGGSGHGHRRHSRRPLTFAGKCQLSGTVVFKPALKAAPAAVKQTVRASGSCSGTLTGARGRTHQLHNAPVRYLATEQGGDISCGAGFDSGKGVLESRWGKLHFSITERRVGPVATLSLTGARGGSANATATAGGNPATIAAQCAGDGLKSASLSGSASTSPSITG